MIQAGKIRAIGSGAALLALPLLLPKLALAATPPSPTPPAPAGRIARISIVGNKNTGAAAVLAEKVGDVYSPAAAEKDRAALQSMGIFIGTVGEAATPDKAGGVDVTYTVVGCPVVKGIVFTADTPDKQPTIPAGTLSVLMKTRVGQVLNTRVLVSDLDALFNRSTGYATQHGYIFDVSPAINIDPKTGVLTIPLIEYRVQSIQITGNRLVKTADILARMHTKMGDFYDGNALDRDLPSIYNGGGFREVRNFTWRWIAPGQLAITIPVVEQAAAQGVLDEERGRVVPFLYDPITDPFPVVQVSVNGRPPLPFVVDTGSSPALSLDPWAVDVLGLKKTALTEQGDGFRYATVSVQSAVFQGKEHTSDVTFNINQAYVIDLRFLAPFIQGQRVAGIIGLAMLSPVTTRFDFAAKTLTVFAYPHPPLLVPGGTVLPLRATPGSVYAVHATLAPGVTADLVLDTGSDTTQIPLAAMNALPPTAVQYNSLYGRIDSLYLFPRLRMPGLTLGTLRVPDAVAGALPPPAMPSLGVDILAGYRLTLDGPNSQLTLEPSARGGHFVPGWSGLSLKQDNDGWSVVALLGGSPARPAGVQVGDQILTINGQSVQGLSEAQIHSLTRVPSLSPLRASLRRGRETLTAAWIPLDEFSRPHTLFYGLTMNKANGGPWVVVGVIKDSPAGLAGLKAGDQITQMGGAAAVGMSLDQFAGLADRPSLPLMVTRGVDAKPLSITLFAPPSITLPVPPAKP